MKKIFIIIIIAVVVGAAGFFGGMKYGQSQNSASTQQSSALQTTGRRFSGVAGGSANGNLVNGQIISMDDKSITVQLRTGGSKIVFFSTSTQVVKSVAGSVKDLLNNENVMVTGTQNSDGSITANSIQLRLPSQNQ